MATGKWRIDRTTSAMLRRILLVNIDHVVLSNNIMATFVKHVMSKNSANKLFFEKLYAIQYREYAKKHYKQRISKVQVPECRKLKSTQDSISTKGFLRCQKCYKPPEEVENSLKNIVLSILGSGKYESATDVERYRVLKECYKVFKHSVPNSVLHQINTFDELKKFYLTPVDTILPMDRLKGEALPQNLHILYEPKRFLPEEDTMFNGQTAFPNSNTLVTGIRTRKKFKGNVVTTPFQAFS